MEEHENKEETLLEWERVQYPRLHALHDRSLSDPSNGWSPAPIIDFSRSDHDNRRSVVFPPVNHEGLHISTTCTDSDRDDQLQKNLSSSSKNYDLDQAGPHLPLPTSRPVPAVSDAEKCWRRGFDLLRSKVTRIAFSLRNFASGVGILWSFHSPAGAVPPPAAAALALFVVVLFFKSRWIRRLRRREESRDHLIRIIKERDEKINQLSRQIAQMNEILLAFHRVPASITG